MSARVLVHTSQVDIRFHILFADKRARLNIVMFLVRKTERKPAREKERESIAARYYVSNVDDLK